MKNFFETLKDLNQNRNKLINFKEKCFKHSHQEASTSNKRINRKIIKCLDLKYSAEKESHFIGIDKVWHEWFSPSDERYGF